MTDAELESRFQVLGHELRCLVCQNQTLADSSADLAKDLRAEVEAQIRAGKSDQEIKNYLVERYGDFVLYKPQLKSQNILLWGGPFALLGLGGLAWTMSRRRIQRSTLPAPQNVTTRANSPEQEKLRASNQEQARRLLE